MNFYIDLLQQKVPMWRAYQYMMRLCFGRLGYI